jgi:hypothetical protein
MPFDRLFIRARGQTYGPFTIEQIGKAILDRRLTPSHEVSPDGETWFSAGTIWSEIRPETTPPPDLDEPSQRRRRRRRSGEASERESDESRRGSSFDRPRTDREDARRDNAGREPSFDDEPRERRPSQPPPLPSVASGTGGTAPDRPPVPAGIPAGDPFDIPPAETVAVPHVDAGRKPTVSEIEAYGSSEPADRAEKPRRRRRSRKPDDAYASHPGDAGQRIPSLPGIAARASLGILIAVLIGHLVTDVFIFLALAQYRDYRDEIRYAKLPPPAVETEQPVREIGRTIDARYELRRTVTAVEAGFWVLSAVLFLVWKYGVNRGLRRSGVAGLQFSPGACVACYFIPIAGQFKPYNAMRELWIAADPYSYDRRRHEATGIVGAWWGLWILGILGAAAAYFWLAAMTRDLDEVDKRYEQMKVELIAVGYGIVLSVTLFILITKFAGRLKEKAAADVAYDAEG